MSAPGSTISLMGEFEFRHEGSVYALPPSLQRVCALLALTRRRLTRSEIAGTLWPELSEERASANLRQVLWRARTRESPVDPTGTSIVLRPDIAVDAYLVVDVARTLLATPPDQVADSLLDPWRLSGELLPSMSDLWLVAYREQLRELRVNALDVIARVAVSRGRNTLAIAAAHQAVTLDGLRESSVRCLIEAHTAHGNTAEAARLYRGYTRRLAQETGMAPSSLFSEMGAALWASSRTG